MISRKANAPLVKSGASADLRKDIFMRYMAKEWILVDCSGYSPSVDGKQPIFPGFRDLTINGSRDGSGEMTKGSLHFWIFGRSFYGFIYLCSPPRTRLFCRTELLAARNIGDRRGSVSLRGICFLSPVLHLFSSLSVLYQKNIPDSTTKRLQCVYEQVTISGRKVTDCKKCAASGSCLPV